MTSPDTFVGYELNEHYKLLRLWYFSRKTKQLLATVRVTPPPRGSRRERYDALIIILKAEGIRVPQFNPKAA